MESTHEPIAALNSLSPALERASSPFEGLWGRLVSTTNWEKGHIIVEWRQAMRDAGAPNSETTDEAFARRVGGVTAQHVGRLRRVWERFAESREQYASLYWSHFQAALDWDDAEMWLEGALLSQWTVSAMRRTRWESQGGAGAEPNDDDPAVASLVDEDFIESQEPSGRDRSRGEDEFPDFEDRERGEGGSSGASADYDGNDDAPFDDHSADDAAGESDDSSSSHESRPLAGPGLTAPPLPPDLADAFEAFKLGIVRHKLAGWSDVSRDDVLTALDVLRELATRTNESKR